MSKEIKTDIRVMVTNSGNVYTTYEDMAKAMNLTKYKTCESPLGTRYNNKTGKVVALKRHLTMPTRLLAGVRLDSGKEIIIGVDGLCFL